MKRMLLLALCLSLGLSGCMPAFLQLSNTPTPAVDLQATAAALNVTMAAQTLQAMPTPTEVPSQTPVIVQPTNTPAATPTLVPSLTSTAFTATNVTSTPGVVSVTVTSTPTLHAQYFGTRPPFVPAGRLLLLNRAHAEAYVSFQCINRENTLSIFEYPVGKWMEVKIASGKCDYVAWVGGREFAGKFSLDTGGQRTITFYKDRIRIK